MTDSPSPRRTTGVGRSRHEFRALMRWYRPYTQGSRSVLSWTIAGTVVVLALQALIPLEIERILHHGIWDPTGIIVLGAMIIALLLVGYLRHLGAHRLGLESAVRLRKAVFAKLMRSPSLRMTGMERNAAVSHHTTDVDNVSDAYEQTIASGLPGLARIVISLGMLWAIDLRAGIVMTIACALFLVVRSAVGQGLVTADLDRLDATTEVGQRVDETVSSSRAVSGLHLRGWVTARFSYAVEDLEHRSHVLGRKIVQLITGVEAAGMFGLFAVVVFATLGGEEAMATTLAALLYVEGVARGLEALPPWVRSVHLAVASQTSIDEILDTPDVPESPSTSAEATRMAEATLDRLRTTPSSGSPSGSMLVGLVAPAGVEADRFLAGYATAPGSYHLPADALAIDASPAEYVRSADSELPDAAVRDLLVSVGLDRLAGSIDTPIGPSGSLINTPERQRLGLAVALAQHPELLAIGPLAALSDPDTAAPLLAAVRETGIPLTILALRDPDVASTMDSMIFATRDEAHVGSHADLLIEYPDYARFWAQRLQANDVDLSGLGFAADVERDLYARLVTERYLPGEAIYRVGDWADRAVFVISGQVEVVVHDPEGKAHRAAVLGPGSSCGDLRLTVAEKRSESVFAINETVVRSLSRDAISAGMMGMLDRSPIERRILSGILREGPATSAELQARLADVAPEAFAAALDLLRRDGAVREDDGLVQAVQKRGTKAGARDLLDRLGDL